MVRELIKVAREHGVPKQVIEKFLDQKAQSEHHTKKSRKYKDLLEGQFSIDKIVRIDRRNDPNTISNKIFDFSYDTLKDLREAGYVDALENLDRQENT